MFSNRGDRAKVIRRLLRQRPERRRAVRSMTGRLTFRRLENHEVDDLVEAYRNGSTVYELAHAFGIHRNTVSATLDRRGVPRRNSKLTGDSVGRATDLYASGLSLAAVGGELGVHASTVASALRRGGVQPRPRAGAGQRDSYRKSAPTEGRRSAAVR